jgi:transcription antitermination protein NusB
MATRREARERALSFCYELEVRGADVASLLDDLPVQPDPYVATLVQGVAEHRDELDAILRKYSEHWALERMPLVDRAVLRIGCYELGWQPELPTGVVISEAVELAKQYSTKDSGRFVNGMLGRIAEDLRAGDPPES